jgi:hypothetical protein
MPSTDLHNLSVAGLFADRDARRRAEQDAEDQLKRRKEEEEAEFKRRLDEFQLTDATVKAALDRIRRAFDKGDTELMITSFPASFCTDGGRAINNADVPPINRPAAREPDADPEWLATVPKGVKVVYDFWKQNLRPGGFKFGARIISYPGGIPGEVGLFFSWPKDVADLAS